MRTYKFKLYCQKKNKHLHQQIDIAGLIYNHCIALHRRYYKLTGKGLNAYELMAHITKLKKRPKYKHWNLVGSQAIQDVVQRIDKGYKLFFGNLKRKVRTSPPSFKKVKRYSSFTLKQAGWKLIDKNRIRIQGIVYKFSKSRDIPAGVKTVTVKRDTLGNLFLYFVVDEPINQTNQATTGNSAGFDFGMKTFLTVSNGKTIESPLYYREAIAELKQAQQNLARKMKFSGGWKKAREIITRIYQRVVNKRRDWFFKVSHCLTAQFDNLFFEDLNMKGMQALWGRKSSDLARSEFMNILEYVAQTKGKVVHLVNRFYPSSKTCHDCGHVYKELQLSEREWVCQSCGTIHDRDLNAALNIHSEGASSLRLGDVRPVLSGNCCLTLESHEL
ncbi:MAG: RNA-guided endonuclease TnpB family protein [Chloroflexi bacterium]|nr:RNA-guided endonuclease TnpB family protein [Chloroflexota bacterium]